MGATASKAYVDKYKAKSASSGRRGILIIGIDGAGKTTITYQLLLGKHVHTVPTMGHNKETLKHDNKKYDLFDVGGSSLVRETWRLYARAADAIIFVVDAHDEMRLPEAADALKKLFFGEDYDAREAKSKTASTVQYDIPLLVFANKQDLPDALGVEKIEELLDLHTLPVRTRMVIPCEAKSGENVQSGLLWLIQELG
mmetsp:Transcript_5575/g.9797  ORF Transcript_5575/g.9797 Transcript_5575/m.9797 type:complete len:198 (+) Transcript_5575:335-928(+)